MAPRRLWIRLRCTPTVRFLFVLISQKGSRGVLLQTQGLIPVSHTHTYTHTHTHLHTHTHTLTLTHTHTYTLTYTHTQCQLLHVLCVCCLAQEHTIQPTRHCFGRRCNRDSRWPCRCSHIACRCRCPVLLPTPSSPTCPVHSPHCTLPSHTHIQTHTDTHTHSHTSLPPSSASFSLLPPFTTRVAQLQARKSRATSCRASWRDPRC